MIELFKDLDNKMPTCPCCSDVLLRHIRARETYLFCRTCRLEMLESFYTQNKNPGRSKPTTSLLEETSRQTAPQLETLTSTLP